jgi:hypothetical protein
VIFTPTFGETSEHKFSLILTLPHFLIHASKAVPKVCQIKIVNKYFLRKVFFNFELKLLDWSGIRGRI